ncbi:hypothetical protein [Cyanobacterium aponinum]|uniref:Uncharacterized protein n=1 Tax=Cyanobacterium aponinum (strain PCC 10605) TaxID=755178 RepID=K9Z1X2_CYAAP|nr:hypothetical protein [Cyanobacterium aponinum]AFZ52707.1 hypothetical protein Cyan10605_0566 [Cyanobacterium aponinum PCC 10605]
MKILTAHELTQQGISLADVQKSLTMTYLTKNFRRKSDLPKKFRDKALNLCAEIEGLGKESFVIETSYSYTVWEEEKVANVEVKNLNSVSPVEANINIQSSQISALDNNKSKDNNRVGKSKSSSQENYSKTEYNIFQYSSKGDGFDHLKARKNQTASISLDTSEDLVKYRGVVVNQPPTEVVNTPQNKPSATPKRKPRTYRGVTY